MSDKKLLIKLAADVESLKNGLRGARKEVDTFEGAVIGAGKAIGAYFGAYSIYRGLEYGVKTMAQFERQMDTVAAITGATGGELKELQDNAINLAGAFRSIDIAKMETELGRLGFRTSEIIDSTKAIVALATATGEDLAKSADTVGSTLRIFNLEASKSGQVTDIMAAGFNESALALDNFTESIKYVGPVANSAGLSLQQTTALLGVLADNGIRGSMAGTSLRKIISDLGRGAAPILTRKLQEMAAAGMSSADAMDEVGRTAYASLLILANNVEKIDALTNSLNNSKGAAEATAKIMEDNLIGDWQKFQAELDKAIVSGSVTLDILRGILQVGQALVSVSWADIGKGISEINPMEALFGLGPSEFEKQQEQWEDRFSDWERRYRNTWDIFNKIQNLQTPAAPIKGFTKNPTVGEDHEPDYMQMQSITDNTIKIYEEYQAEQNALNEETRSMFNEHYEQLYGDWMIASEREIDAMEAHYEEMEKVQEEAAAKLAFTAGIIMKLGDAIGDSLVDSIETGEKFGHSLLKQTDQIIQQLYRQAVGWILLNAAKIPNPLAAIAVATGGAIAMRAAFAGIRRSQDVSSSSDNGASFQRQKTNHISGSFRLRGSDLVASIDNYDRQRSRTGG
jgi:hypothetical protein